MPCWLMVSETRYNSFASDSGLLLGIAETRSRLAMQMLVRTSGDDADEDLPDVAGVDADFPDAAGVDEDFPDAAGVMILTS